MDRVYISGPITNDPNYEEEFARVEKDLKSFGYTVTNPVKIGKQLDRTSYKKNKREDYMKADLKALLECDGIYFMNGSEESEGCKIEKLVAEQSGIPTLKISHLDPKW